MKGVLMEGMILSTAIKYKISIYPFYV